MNTPAIHTVLGIVALTIILVASLWAIYSPRIPDGLIGRVLYMVNVVTCLAGFSHILNDTFPKNIAVTLIVVMAVHMVRDIVVAHYKAPIALWWLKLRIDAQRRNQLK